MISNSKYQYYNILGLIIFVTLFLVFPIESQALEWLPGNKIFRPYMASPRSHQLKFGYISVSDPSIPETGTPRWALRAGDRLGILRWDQSWQISVFGGYNGLFDIENGSDNIGWDGFFGATLSSRLTRSQALKIEFSHQSAHIGDELIERTGRRRIDYTRQEFNLGYSFEPFYRSRFYAETGWAFDLRNPDIQEPWRFQTGFEYGIPQYPKNVDNFHHGPFIFSDFESMEELDWQIDTTIQAGYQIIKDNVSWRFGLEYRNGRVPLGEFFRSEESYIGISLWRTSL